MMQQKTRGYVFAIGGGYIGDAVHVERDDELWAYGDDAEAAKAAEADGIELIYGMPGVPNGVYLDTAENRAAIRRSIGT